MERSPVSTAFTRLRRSSQLFAAATTQHKDEQQQRFTMDTACLASGSRQRASARDILATTGRARGEREGDGEPRDVTSLSLNPKIYLWGL